MAALVERVRSSSFWGLVQQKGPWKSTASDRERAKQSSRPTVGGGIPAGGTKHAGFAGYEQTMTPYQMDARGAPPKPLLYHSGKHHQSKGMVGGIRSTVAPVASRTRPFYVGEDAGSVSGLPVGYAFPNTPQGVRYEEDDESSSDEDFTMVDYPALPQTFGLTEHRLEEAAEAPVKEEQVLPPMESKPTVGVTRRPREKTRMHPYEKGHKASGRAETIREGKDNILQLTSPVEQVPVTTFKPPRFDQIHEIKKVTQKAIADERAFDRKRRSSTDLVPESGEKKKKVPFSDLGTKRKMEGESAGPSKKGKQAFSALGEKRKGKALEKGEEKKTKITSSSKVTLPVAEKEKKKVSFKKTIKPLPKLKTVDLPPPTQRLKVPGARAEKKSAPKKKDQLPERGSRSKK